VKKEINIDELRVATEVELRHMIYELVPEEYAGMRSMLAYHLGWEGEGAGLEAQGKRIRPILLLLCTEAAGGDWRKAVPAAAAVELVHNFSLIHDDIQDQSRMRRGRNTVWVNWGIAHAINAGDLMFTLAFTALQELGNVFKPDVVLGAVDILQKTCIKLTGGQFLDLSYEQQPVLPAKSYWPMIYGKTAALIAGCTQLGALLAQTGSQNQENFREFGEKLGLAFQVRDDWLGIWGDAARTGKSTESDLLTGKKSLPVVYGLEKQDRFARRWMEGSIQAEEVSMLADLLESEGAEKYTRDQSDRLTHEALQALNRACEPTESKRQLELLSEKLLKRDN
jgi:geranylgeranyl diphosphate synthase, type I